MSVPPIILWDQAYNRSGEKIQRAVVNAIRTHVDNTTLAGFVGRETLARYTGLTIKQVDRQIAANVAAGWLEIVRPGGRNQSIRRANDYQLTYPTKKDIYVPDSDVGTFMSTGDGHLCPDDLDINVAPTTPLTSNRTSPERSSDGEDTFETEFDSRSHSVIEDPWAEPSTDQVQPQTDPFGSVGDDFASDATTPVPSDINVQYLGDVSVPVDFVQHHRDKMHRNNPFYTEEEVILWPSGTPLPDDLDESGTTYLDDHTGAVLHLARDAIR